MGGGINESRVVVSRKTPTEHEVLRLMAMLRNRDEVLAAVAERMAVINIQVDRAHELVGMLLHVEQAIDREIDIQRPIKGVRTVIPRMGRLPYGLRFKTGAFLQLLDELRLKTPITQDDIRQLAVRATQETADHYETLLFMAYVLGLLGQYELADRYVNRALQSAERHQRDDRQEALFFHVLCTRALATEPSQYRGALEVLDRISTTPPDARHLAEQGNIRLRWYLRAVNDETWRPAPSLTEATGWLEQAALAANEPRLLASIQNSLCYAWTNAYEIERTPDLRRRANASLAALTETLYAIEKDPAHWPLRVLDTIARGNVVFALEGAAYDPDFVRTVVQGIRGSLDDDTFAGDRKELQHRLTEYEAALNRLGSEGRANKR
jgi:hypothetical protein